MALLTFPSDVSPTLKAHIKQSERLMLTAYFDAAGVPTIGWGHIKGVTASHVRQKRTITEALAVQYFEDDLDNAEWAVRRHVKVPLNQGQYDALVDFVFNLGEGAFAKSTLLKLLNKGQYDAVPEQLARWNKAKDPRTGKLRVLNGLVKRRAYEIALWNSVVTQPVPSTNNEATTSPVPTPGNTSLWTLLIGFFLKLIGGFNAQPAHPV